MRNRIPNFAGAFPALAAIALTGIPSGAMASSHREAPLISEDPAADNCDLYAWVNRGSHDKLNLVATYIPLEEPSGGPNFHKFSDDVLYAFHIVRGVQSLEPVISYYILFQTSPAPRVAVDDRDAPPGGGKEFFIQLSGQVQTYTVYKTTASGELKLIEGAKVAPPNIGPRSYGFNQRALTTPAATEPEYNDAYAARFITNLPNNEGRVWAGPRDDGFYVDLGGIFDLANLRPKGVAQDGVAGFNTHAIALEIPTNLLTDDGNAPGNTPSNRTLIGVYAAAYRQRATLLKNNGSKVGFGDWVQVSRLGLPLINEAVIGLQAKDRWNRAVPGQDVPIFGAYFLNPIIVRDAEAVGIYAALGADPTPFKYDRTDILDVINLKNIPSAGAHSVPLTATGDVLRVDLATDSGFPNGRPLVGGARPNQEQADVTDVLLSLLLTKLTVPISDGVDYNDKDFLPTMPWLALPHQGYAGGHGKPTP